MLNALIWREWSDRLRKIVQDEYSCNARESFAVARISAPHFDAGLSVEAALNLFDWEEFLS